MKKRVMCGVFIFLIVLSISFGSAFWPFDYFKNIFTGNVIMQVEYTCGNYSLSTPSNAVASSSYSSQYSAGKANDGSASTSWVSSALSGPHWIYFDLGSKKCINKVNLFVDYNYLPMAVNVQVSDNAINWSNVVIRKGVDFVSIESSSTEITFDKIEGRYIRIYESENVQSSGPPEANVEEEVITIVAQIIAQMFEYGSLGEIMVNSAPRIATPTATKIRCYDSDVNATYPNGLNYYKKGIADNRTNYGGSWYEDKCFYLNQTGSLLKYVQVDNCFGDNCTLQEGYCSGDSSVSNITYGCPYGCMNGACISQALQCIDSDGGKNYSIKGNLTSGAKVVFDRCYNDSLLLEMFCDVSSSVHLDGTGKAEIDRHECGEGMKCDDGICLLSEEEPQEPITASENLKNMSKYSEREVFLISDKNWKDVLPLVPVTTWTGNETNCTRGYGTPENVCVYPTLIYQSEDKIELSLVGYPTWAFPWEKNEDFEYNFIYEKNNLKIGDIISVIYSIKDNRPFKKIEIQNLPDFLEIVSPPNGIYDDINTNFPYQKNFEFKLKVKDNVNDSSLNSFDADSIIYFMQQYQNNNKEKVTIVGNSPKELDDLLIAQPELGAGIQQGNINRINTQNYLSYWMSYKDVVYVEDNYELALMASTYASLINAPLIIQGSSLDNSSTFSGRNVTCVGNVDKNCSEKYNLEQLQKKYVELTKTDKIILVNPNDLNIKVKENFQPEKSTDRILDIYTKSSITSPILAGAKHEVITFSRDVNYTGADRAFTEQFLKMYGYSINEFDVKECVFGSDCSSAPDIERIPARESLSDEISFYFKVDNESNIGKKIESIKIPEMVVPPSCLGDNPSANLTVNDKSYSFRISSYDLNSRFYKYGKIGGFIDLKRNFPNEPLVLDESGVNITLKIKGCKIFKLDGNEIKLKFEGWKYITEGVTIISDGSDNFQIISESETKDSYISAEGLGEGNKTIFSFQGLNENYSYRIGIEPSNPVYYDQDVKYYIQNAPEILDKSQIISGKASLELTAKRYLSEHTRSSILKIDKIKLYPIIGNDKYLTIIASPQSIQMSSSPSSSGGMDFRSQTDSYYKYINYNYSNDFLVYHLIGGRIFGISTSDVSSYFARDLFFDKIYKSKNASFIFRGLYPESTAEQVISSLYFDYYWKSENNIYNEFENVYKCYSCKDPESGCDTKERDTKESFFNSYLTVYVDHGYYNSAFLTSEEMKNKYLQPKTSYIYACATCDFDMAQSYNDTKNLLCMQNLRRGSLGYIGAQSLTYGGPGLSTREFIPQLVLNKKSIGEAWKLEEDSQNDGNDAYLLLIGDPTFKPIYWGEVKGWKSPFE